MKLFKYYANLEYLKETLQNNTLYFAEAKQLNDPFEEIALFKIKGDELLWASDNAKNGSKICCFSTDECNYLLWSHYANKHTGVCVEFDFKKVHLKDDLYCYTNICNQNIVFGKMKYLIEPKEYDKPPEEINLSGDEYLKIFHQKYEIWKYEREVRAIIMSKESRKVNFPRSYLKKIVLGYKCTDEMEIRKILKDKKHDIPIKRAVISFSTSKVLIE
jgi:hypothetical protein